MSAEEGWRISLKKHKHYSGEFYHKHSLGQNFIEDEALLEQLAEYSLVTSQDCVLEIGPGMGALTKPLAARAKQVVSLEIDLDHTLSSFLKIKKPRSPVNTELRGDTARFHPNSRIIIRLILCLNAAERLPYGKPIGSSSEVVVLTDLLRSAFSRRQLLSDRSRYSVNVLFHAILLKI